MIKLSSRHKLSEGGDILAPSALQLSAASVITSSRSGASNTEKLWRAYSPSLRADAEYVRLSGSGDDPCHGSSLSSDRYSLLRKEDKMKETPSEKTENSANSQAGDRTVQFCDVCKTETTQECISLRDTLGCENLFWKCMKCKNLDLI